MAIPETQLDTWSGQGAIAGSRDTYKLIKGVLESDDSPYVRRNFEVFLQGSYKNDTNVHAESDVDVVIKLTSAYQYNIDSLPMVQKAAIQRTFTGGVTYNLAEFKRDVLTHLKDHFSGSVTDGEKAIQIAEYGKRRKADVIVCMDFRKYTSYVSPISQHWKEGIWFKSASGLTIANFPKLHSDNLTTRHQATAQWLKPTVRIFKNMRRKMISEGLIMPNDAPSYFIEGMLYNIPTENFGVSYSDTVRNCLVWLNAATRADLICANGQHKLLYPHSPVTWRKEQYDAFIEAAIKLWNEWS
jgi:hypothetical protein